jgi:rhomboid protease GluP
MIDLRQLAQHAPVTLAILAIYLLVATLTNPFDPPPEALERFGACIGLRVAEGEAWRLLTYAFLHGGLLHLLCNGWFLLVIGPMLEVALGPWRYFALYVAGALGGGLAGDWANGPLVPLVGGSGALFGMLGAMLAMHVRHGRNWTDFLEDRGARSVISLIVANLALGLLIPYVSNAGHAGGLVAGFVASFCFLARGRHAPDRVSRLIQAGWLTLTASLVLWTLEPFPREDALVLAADRAPDRAAAEPFVRALERRIAAGEAADLRWALGELLRLRR